MQQQANTQQSNTKLFRFYTYFEITQNNQLVEIYNYFKQFVNIITNNIDNFIQTYVAYEKNIDFIMPGPYDDIDGSTWSKTSDYDGYNGYDN
jgi:hypothetical protein